MERSPSAEGDAKALLATAETLTGLILDEQDIQIFIKEESTSPSSSHATPFRIGGGPPKPGSASPSKKLTGVAARKAAVAQQRTGKHVVGKGASASSKGSQVKSPPTPGQPIIPRKNQDWDPWKDVLYELYITQNRILRDIIGIMETKHNLRATSKMFKNQFARWGFFKYAIKGRSRAKVESPIDQSSDDSLDGALVLSRDNLLHADNGTRSLQSGLTAVRRFILGHVDLEPANLQVEEVAGFVDPCYRYFRVAMDLFDLNENLEGGRVLRLAFLQIERKISKPTMKSFSDLCILVPHLLHESGRRDILSAYLNYLSRLATVKFGNHPIPELAASFATLVEERPEDAMRFIMLLSQVNSDTIGALPGVLDRTVEWARNQYLACQRTNAPEPWRSPVSTTSSSSGSSTSSEGHDNHMLRLEAQSVYWAQKLIMHDPISDETALQWLHRRFSSDFVERCEGFITRLQQMVASGGFPIVFARMMECLYVGWLYDYYEARGQWEKAFHWGRRGLELSSDEQYAIWSIHLEDSMRRHGWAGEAEELTKRRREHAWLEKVRGEVDRLAIA
ncbi:hypothetical protein B0J18DRAFT_281996 [Chaetomium sp. MPI-SDFR-AT-0129]|nr:hypothetical protein B0J18DRAFT_281996 [Chaetomium sp. MPI-SDFR-AT-0129]